jgi:O-acetyl-ADP-ribose deacetylase (regulator of RNase III)
MSQLRSSSEFRLPVSQVAVEQIEGNVFTTTGDALVNPYNRNLIPWWLLVPGGISGQLRREAGREPFRELTQAGRLSLGEAVLTEGGQLGRPIIHVAGLNHCWRATERSVTESCWNLVAVAGAAGFESVVMPVIGAGHGGRTTEQSLATIGRAFSALNRPSLLAPPVDHSLPVLTVTLVLWDDRVRADAGNTRKRRFRRDRWAPAGPLVQSARDRELKW